MSKPERRKDRLPHIYVFFPCRRRVQKNMKLQGTQQFWSARERSFQCICCQTDKLVNCCTLSALFFKAALLKGNIDFLLIRPHSERLSNIQTRRHPLYPPPQNQVSSFIYTVGSLEWGCVYSRESEVPIFPSLLKLKCFQEEEKPDILTLSFYSSFFIKRTHDWSLEYNTERRRKLNYKYSQAKMAHLCQSLLRLVSYCEEGLLDKMGRWSNPAGQHLSSYEYNYA